MQTIAELLAQELGASPVHVQNVIDLLDQGNTIPFIARYRKELHGSMDDTALRKLEDRLTYLRNLEQRRQEHQALTLALSALEQANARLQERFSPALNRLAGEYLSRLTGQRYRRVSFTRELEGSAATAGDLSPRSALSLSRGTADQLYLSLRLAVCRLCLPEKPPIVLDDALAAFDDQRLGYALDLLRELAEEQQILLFTCHRREGTLLAGDPAVKQLTLQE